MTIFGRVGCECCGNVFVGKVDLKKHMDGKHSRLWDFYGRSVDEQV